MKLPYFAFLALLGGFAFLILFIADREKKLGEDRRSVYRIPHSELYADPDLKLVRTTARTCVLSASSASAIGAEPRNEKAAGNMPSGPRAQNSLGDMKPNSAPEA